ncbi:aldehyde dehydrogenase family protein [Natronolimnobius sp. AArcel1]|uniref:2,5-dioxovalerate dehydrogenase n=1 Tax=Natronolimnobius sp. AArcel1 TaxID=1679093 RepID=UPI0013EA5411|nr:aldehyde dehydrogenase family protein [Natronolimnobius sp. AArcel1]NGM69821.1 aldehyde dehydrogenase family protein [Natronolimnobius sp. AArcel1]
MTADYQNYVDGEWIQTGTTFETANPAVPSETVATYQEATVEDAAAAVEAAAAAEDEWANTPAPQRGAILREAASILADRKAEITDLLIAEEGKTQAEAGGEVQRAIDIFYYYAEKTRDLGGSVKSASSPRTNLYTKNEPVGVAALITPWNYPIAIPAWKIAPALATGNTLVLKPAKVAPGVALEIFKALDEAGLPDGVANVVVGPGSTVGNELVVHEDVDAVSFTGSGQVGHMIYDKATDDGKRVQTELGGKNPTVVSDTADVEEAAAIIAAGAFGTTGQSCTATSRAIVHTDVYDEFVDAIVAEAESIKIGPGKESDMGPQVNESELEGTLDYIEVAENEGATLATGGGQPDEFDEGHFVEPTVFTDVDNEFRIAQEEVFGPVLAVIEVDDFEEALETANDVDYGLSSSIVTNDHTEAERFVDEIEAGVAKINDKTTGLELHVPFGGFKQSSSETWREQGDAGIDFYTIEKTVYDGF